MTSPNRELLAASQQHRDLVPRFSFTVVAGDPPLRPARGALRPDLSLAPDGK